MSPKKSRVADLAIAGGPPAFIEPLHVGRPNVAHPEAFLQRMRGVLESSWLTNNGPLVREFEARVAEAAQVEHCVAVCNAGLGMDLVLAALGITGDAIVPSMTFVSTPHVLQWRGMRPVFCDIDRRTLCMHPAAAEDAITPRTSAIIPTHLFGNACDVEAFEDLAARRGLALVFDAAHAFGCSHRRGRVGAAGRAEVFSFHATKFVNSFEGGAVTTNDGDLADKLRLMRNYGFRGIDRVLSVGINAKMSEVAAAMGLTSLDDAGLYVEVNRRNLLAYRASLGRIGGVSFLEMDIDRSNCQYVVALVDGGCALDRDALYAVLHSENVLARRYFHPGAHRMEPYRTLYPEAHRTLPNTERAAADVLCFPSGMQMSVEGVELIGSIVETCCRNADEVRKLLSRGAAAPRTTVTAPGSGR